MSRETQKRTISHKSHTHPLQLSSPTLTLVSCAACANPISSSSPAYSCPPCHYHIHHSCSDLPPLIRHNQHTHRLKLTFLPSNGNSWFFCNVCRKVGGNHWLYRCDKCQFDAHLGCASSAMAADGAASSRQAMFANQPGKGSAPAGKSLINSAINGIVEGATSQVAQTIVQEIMQDGDNVGILDVAGEIILGVFNLLG